VNLTLALLDQPPTRPRLLLLQLTTAIAQFDGLMRDQQLDELKYQLWKLEQLATYQSVVVRNTDCSFVYWISNLVPAMFSDVFSGAVDGSQVQRLHYLFLAFNDCAQTLFSEHHAPLAAGAAAPADAAGAPAPGSKQRALQLEYRNEILGHL